MYSVELDKPSRRIGAPANWDIERHGICHTLEVCDDNGWMVSAWKPTAKELAALNAGKAIFLCIAGSPTTQHPVVALAVQS